jgi:hypothetical protein
VRDYWGHLESSFTCGYPQDSSSSVCTNSSIDRIWTPRSSSISSRIFSILSWSIPVFSFIMDSVFSCTSVASIVDSMRSSSVSSTSYFPDSQTSPLWTFPSASQSVGALTRTVFLVMVSGRPCRPSFSLCLLSCHPSPNHWKRESSSPFLLSTLQRAILPRIFLFFGSFSADCITPVSTGCLPSVISITSVS